MWRLGRRCGVPLVIGVTMFAGPEIGSGSVVDTRDPLPAETAVIAQRPCELVERFRLAEASATEIRAFREGAIDEFTLCTYEGDGFTFVLGLLEGETLRATRNPEFTQADFLAGLVAADPAARGIRGIGEGAVRTGDGAVWGRQGDLIVRVTAAGLEAAHVDAITGLALGAAAGRS